MEEQIFIELLKAILPEAATDAKNRKVAFAYAVEEAKQILIQAQCNVDIHCIEFNFVKNWSNRYSRAVESQKSYVIELYLSAIRSKYPQLTNCLNYTP